MIYEIGVVCFADNDLVVDYQCFLFPDPPSYDSIHTPL